VAPKMAMHGFNVWKLTTMSRDACHLLEGIGRVMLNC